MDERSFRNPKLHAAGLIAYKAFADLAGKGSLLLVTIVAARRLTTEGFGLFSLGSTLGWLVAVITDGGIQMHVARAVARRPADAGAILRAWLRVRVGTAAAAVAVVAMVTATGWPAVAAPLTAFAAMYACSALLEFLFYVFRGLSRTDVESSLIVAQRAGTLVFGIGVLFWRRDVTLLAAAMLVPVVATLAVASALALRLAGPATRTVTVRRELGEVWPIGAGIVLSALYFRVDVFLVQWWAGIDAVAQYNAVFRLVDALRLLPAAVMAVALPAFCRATDLRPLARAALPLTAAAVAAAAVLWLVAEWLIPAVYGARYGAGAGAFRILLLAFPLMTVNMALTHQLIGWDGQRTYAALCAAAVAVNLLLNARLISSLGIAGAAWATVATEAFLTVGCAIALRSGAARAFPESVVA